MKNSKRVFLERMDPQLKSTLKEEIKSTLDLTNLRGKGCSAKCKAVTSFCDVEHSRHQSLMDCITNF